MTNEVIRRLTESFMHFPGVGPKQAKRFVYYLLTLSAAGRHDIAKAITALTDGVKQCSKCQRFYTTYNNQNTEQVCNLCRDPNRNQEQLLIIEKDVDLDNVERAGMYQGQYFVLGGLVSILSPNPKREIRADKLLERITTDANSGKLKEVIVALSTNPQGDHTLSWLKSFLAPQLETHTIKYSALGRGLSTGSELEYSDSDTLKSAWDNRG